LIICNHCAETAGLRQSRTLVTAEPVRAR